MIGRVSEDGQVLAWPVTMVTDLNSLDVMKFICAKTGVVVNVLAKAGDRYSNRGGQASSIVPKNHVHVEINAGKNKIADFWTMVSQEKTKRRLAWLAAHPDAV